MPVIPEAPLSILALTTTTTTGKVGVMVFIVVVVGAAIHYASPFRLTSILVAAIDKTEKIYLEAVETGVLTVSDVHTAEMLSSVQVKVSKIREASLVNSRSNWKTLCGFVGGRTITVIQCIWEVRDVETQIEILKETRLRKSNLNPRVISLRRRRGCPNDT